MKSISIGMLVCLAGMVACTSQKLPTDPEPSDDDTTSSSSGDVSSSSSGESSSSSSSGDTSSSSSSGSTSSSSSSGSVEDGGTDGEAPDTCTVITATGWVQSEVCGPTGDAPCPTTYESEFTPVFPNTFIDFVRVVFDQDSTAVNTPYDFSLDPAVWQRDLSGLVGNSAADARYFKAESGVLQLSGFSDGSVDGTLTNVKLVEVTYDQNGQAQVVEGGTCLRLTTDLVVQN